MWNIFILTSIDYPATDLENIPSDRWWLVFLQISRRNHSIWLSTVQWVGGEPELSIFSPQSERGWSQEGAQVSLATS